MDYKDSVYDDVVYKPATSKAPMKPSPHAGQQCESVYDDTRSFRQPLQATPPPVSPKPTQTFNRLSNSEQLYDDTRQTPKSSQNYSPSRAPRPKPRMSSVTDKASSLPNYTHRSPVIQTVMDHTSRHSGNGSPYNSFHECKQIVSNSLRAAPTAVLRNEHRSPVSAERPIDTALHYQNIQYVDQSFSTPATALSGKHGYQQTGINQPYENVDCTKQVVTTPTQFKFPAQKDKSRSLSQSDAYESECSKGYVNTALNAKPCEMADLKSFTLPQLVCISSGFCGQLNQPILREGEELIVLFSKVTTVVPAYKPGMATEVYNIPLNSAFKFGVISNPTSTNQYDESDHFATVEDLLLGTKDLPKVVKVLKSFSGKTVGSSVVAGSLIFPKRVVAVKKGKENLICLNNFNDKMLSLELSCAGNFSTHPTDVRLSLPQYVRYIDEFPATIKAFNYNRMYDKISSIDAGTLFILNQPTMMDSYICTKDVFGKKKYPLLEVPTEVPVTVQCISKREGVDMYSILKIAQEIYKKFRLSMIEGYVSVCSERCFDVQDELYHEVHLDTKDADDYYAITPPEEMHSYDYVLTKFPIHEKAGKKKRSHAPPPTGDSSPEVSKCEQMPNPQLQTAEEQNRAYLESLSCDDVLKLLDSMNLGQHKRSFRHEQVDGHLLASLTATHLKELGVTKNLHQKRLLNIINGSRPVKEYVFV